MKVKTSKKEQISVVALYSNNETVLEELLHFTPAEGVGRRVALNTHSPSVLSTRMRVKVGVMMGRQ